VGWVCWQGKRGYKERRGLGFIIREEEEGVSVWWGRGLDRVSGLLVGTIFANGMGIQGGL
jgi:hypothetical protein